jgi:hypothetical protein
MAGRTAPAPRFEKGLEIDYLSGWREFYQGRLVFYLCSIPRRKTETLVPRDPGEYRLLRHFDYGLLREVRDSLQYDDMLEPDGTRQRIVLNPFTASTASISAVAASELGTGADLDGPFRSRELPGGKVERIDLEQGGTPPSNA